jgi:pyruvate dehydrogenase E2 component (dihydrolipoamide acetyltransferase)
MRHPLLMPKLGLTMAEGTIVEWTCPVDTPFKEGDSVFVVETDKVANEIPADASGVLTEILAEAGQTVSVGEVVGYWEDAGEASMAGTSQAGSSRGKPETAPPARGTSSATSMESLQIQRADEGTPMRVRATPLARRLASELDVELKNIHGTGPDASIKARDIHAVVAARVPGPAPTAGASMPGGSTSDGRTRFRPNAAQAAMAQRLTAVKQEVPHFYLAVDAQVTRLLALRSEPTSRPRSTCAGTTSSRTGR